MKISSLLVVFAILALFPVSTFSQSLQNDLKVHRPDFSGTWKLNLRKSGFTGEITPEARDTFLVIEQNLPAIKVSFRTGNKNAEAEDFNVTFYSDGRGDEMGGFGSFGTVSEWEGDTLVTKSFTSPDRKNISEAMELRLSADGKVLTGTKRNASLRENLNGEMVRIFMSAGSPLVFDRTDSAAFGEKIKTH
jgi:hypothetical protein